MAAILECHSCGEYLAEVGDLDKGYGRKAYRVYDSVGNLSEGNGEYRLIECLACNYIGHIENFE